jgi:hypothetical protein
MGNESADDTFLLDVVFSIAACGLSPFLNTLPKRVASSHDYLRLHGFSLKRNPKLLAVLPSFHR